MTTQRLETPIMDTAVRGTLTNVKAGTLIANSDTNTLQFSPFDNGTYWQNFGPNVFTLDSDINFDASKQGFNFLTDNLSDHTINLVTGDNVVIGGAFYVNCNSGTTVVVQADGGVTIDGVSGATYKMPSPFQSNRFVKVAIDTYQTDQALYYPGTGLTMTDNPDNSHTFNVTFPPQTIEYPIGYVSGLTSAYTSDTTITLQPGSCRNSTNSSNIALASSVVVNIALAGAVNRLDAGVVAANTWYYLYVIANASGSLVGGLLSASSTSPTLPPGYTRSRRVGAARYLAAKIAKFVSSGMGQTKNYLYVGDTGDTRVLLGGGAIVQSSVACSAFIPPTASNNFLAGVRLTPITASFVYFQDTGNTSDIAQTNYRSLSQVAAMQLIQNYTIPTSSSKSVDYVLSELGASLNLIVIGFSDNL